MKVNHLLMAMTLGLTLSACSANKQVEKTTDHFIQALEQQNWDEAKALTTPESHGFLAWLESANFGSSEDGDVEMYQYQILSDKTVINGDSATVTTLDEFNNESVYRLVKVDGKWPVDFTIPGMGDMEQQTQELNDLQETLDDMGDAIDDLSEQLEDLGNEAR